MTIMHNKPFAEFLPNDSDKHTKKYDNKHKHTQNDSDKHTQNDSNIKNTQNPNNNNNNNINNVNDPNRSPNPSPNRSPSLGSLFSYSHSPQVGQFLQFLRFFLEFLFACLRLRLPLRSPSRSRCDGGLGLGLELGLGRESWSRFAALVCQVVLLGCYVPLGLCILCVRLFWVGVIAVLLYFVPQRRYALPPWLVRVVLFFLGFVVFVDGPKQPRHRRQQLTKRSQANRQELSQHQPLILACNHRTALDVLPFLMVENVNVLIDADFFSVVSQTFQKVVGAIPIDQSHKYSSANPPEERERAQARLRDYIKDQLSASRHPLLFFPEGWDTSGDVGLLMYNKFLFSVNVPVQPVAMEAYVWPRALPLVPGALGVSLLSEIAWFLFFPCTVYRLHYLEVQERGHGELPEDFARRVQVMTARRLGTFPTRFSNKDALRFRRALLRYPELRAIWQRHQAMTSRSVPEPDDDEHDHKQ